MKYKITESYRFAYLMTIFGGFIGAYSYKVRGGVFASAQTGNLIQLGLKIIDGNFDAWYLHLLPVFMFCLGIICCEIIKNTIGENKKIHWKQIVLVIKALILLLISFIAIGEYNVIANMLIGFIAGMQLQFVRMVEGVAMMTTMLTGNIRTLAEYAYYGIYEKNNETLIRSLKQLLIVVMFIFGVLLGGFVSVQFGQQAILFGLVFLFMASLMMIFNKDNI